MCVCEGSESGGQGVTDRKQTPSPSPHSSNRCLTGKLFSQLGVGGGLSFTMYYTRGAENKKKLT